MIRLSSYAAVASAIRTLVVYNPGVLLRSTVVGPWGLMRLGLTETLVVSLPGCLSYLSQMDAYTVNEVAQFEAGTLARALSEQLVLKSYFDTLLVTINDGDQTYHSCCLVDGAKIPWVNCQVLTAPDVDRTIEIPPPAERPIMRESSVFTLPYLAVPFPVSSLAAFRNAIGDDPDAPYAPLIEREQRRQRWLLTNLRAERARLRLFGIAEPAWLSEGFSAHDLPPAPRVRQL